MVPCGTCDYISPEILQAHEEALVALEMSDDGHATNGEDDEKNRYGLETDWWSLGAMLFEMAYGVAPFFAKDIRQTYLKIMNHKVCASVHAFDVH
jgi:serine/threonine protein kinase